VAQLLLPPKGFYMKTREEDHVKTKTAGGKKMKAIEYPTGRPTYWQLIFLQSKVNGARYKGEDLARQHWDWPKDTYFQRRLHLIKFLKPEVSSNLS
jgi:hypothetical protein